MQLDTEEYTKATEGSILKAVLTEYKLQHPAEKEIQAIAAIAGSSDGTIQNCLVDNAHLGEEAWTRIEIETKTTLRQEWISVLRKMYGLSSERKPK